MLPWSCPTDNSAPPSQVTSLLEVTCLHSNSLQLLQVKEISASLMVKHIFKAYRNNKYFMSHIFLTFPLLCTEIAVMTPPVPNYFH